MEEDIEAMWGRVKRAKERNPEDTEGIAKLVKEAERFEERRRQFG
ncbi:hypothetical protein [Paramagnetospirillum kuznetsovii]|nr:hypothetical protein [Paramagnetospirillum kuznetsovii]